MKFQRNAESTRTADARACAPASFCMSNLFNVTDTVLAAVSVFVFVLVRLVGLVGIWVSMILILADILLINVLLESKLSKTQPNKQNHPFLPVFR